MTLYETGDKKQSLAALLHAIDHGVTRFETVASALVVGKEVGELGATKDVILRRIPVTELHQIEAALAATFVEPVP